MIPGRRRHIIKTRPEDLDPHLIREGSILIFKGELEPDCPNLFELIEKIRNEDTYGLTALMLDP